MKYYLIVVCLVVFALITACQAPVATPTAQSVGDAYMAALETGDAEAMLAQVSEDVTLVIDGGAIFYEEVTGTESMREYLAGLASQGFQLELTGAPFVNGNQATYPDRFALNDFKAIGVDWVAGQDVLTIENGKVTRDVWTIDPTAETALNEGLIVSGKEHLTTAVASNGPVNPKGGFNCIPECIRRRVLSHDCVNGFH